MLEHFFPIPISCCKIKTKVDQELVHSKFVGFFFLVEDLHPFHVWECWHGAAFHSQSGRMCDTPGNVSRAVYQCQCREHGPPRTAG